MNIKSFPNNQDEYVGAEHLMRWFHGRTSGVWGAENELAVTVVPDAMSVTVSDGNGWFANSKADGIAWWIDTEEKTGLKLTLEADMADGAMDRIDRVVVTWPTTNYVALPTVNILKGTPAAYPVPPALVNNSAQRQVSLAQLRVRAGALFLTEADVTDERFDETVCGLVTDQCRIDTSVIQRQIRALIDAMQKELTNVIAGDIYDLKPIRVQNVTISPGDFLSYEIEDGEEQKLYDMGYVYRAAVSITGVLSNMTPYVTLSLPDVEESGAAIANQFRAYEGGIYVYADGIPASTITALTIECRKAVTA